jgi:hypothetical protein
MSGMVVSVGHLMNVKRFDTEIKIEIKDCCHCCQGIMMIEILFR